MIDVSEMICPEETSELVSSLGLAGVWGMETRSKEKSLKMSK